MDLPVHQLTMTVLMTPDMANFAGNVHGGTILKYLDQVAYACASCYAGCYVVTLSVDQVIFREPGALSREIGAAEDNVRQQGYCMRRSAAPPPIRGCGKPVWEALARKGMSTSPRRPVTRMMLNPAALFPVPVSTRPKR
jgi:hypothetical protein